MITGSFPLVQSRAVMSWVVVYVCVCVCGNLLGQGLLQRSQRRVCVGRVRLQGLDSVFQAAQLLVFVPQLVLQVLDLHGRAVVTRHPSI